jgi:hypothetical protein
MADFRFERECRTQFSEAYLISVNEEQVGRVDLHFTSSIVYATLCVNENMTSEDIQDLIDAIDEDLIMSADVARDDFIVTVYQGREVGVFSDEEFEEEED